MTVTRHRLFAAVSFTAVFFSFLLAIQAVWIPIKAELAQWLIQQSWQKTLEGDPSAKPWPWADTRALGVLVIPEQAIRQFVLEGNSGRNLAFGPVLLNGAADGSDLVLSGHRDTHFHFLQDLSLGQRVQLELPDGLRQFEVSQIDIVDSRTADLVLEPGMDRLSLVTCYPFDTQLTRGPLRYVVTALPVDAEVSPMQRSPSSG